MDLSEISTGPPQFSTLWKCWSSQFQISSGLLRVWIWGSLMYTFQNEESLGAIERQGGVLFEADLPALLISSNHRNPIYLG